MIRDTAEDLSNTDTAPSWIISIRRCRDTRRCTMKLRDCWRGPTSLPPSRSSPTKATIGSTNWSWTGPVQVDDGSSPPADSRQVPHREAGQEVEDRRARSDGVLQANGCSIGIASGGSMKKFSSAMRAMAAAHGFLRRRLHRDHERKVAPVGVGQLQHGVDRDVFRRQRGRELRDDARADPARGIANSKPSDAASPGSADIRRAGRARTARRVPGCRSESRAPRA